MVRVTRLENFYICRLLNATKQLRIDGSSKPATGYGGVGYSHPRRFRAHPVRQRELPVKGVNGKPVNVPVIRRAWRIIAHRAFAAVRLTILTRKCPCWNIGGLRSYVEDDPVDIRRDRRVGVIHDQRERLCSGRRAGPVNRRVWPARQLNPGPSCFPLKSGLVTVMLSGTATRAVLGPPIRPQPPANRSPAATAAATGIDRPDMPVNSRTAHHVSCPHAPSAAIVCGRRHSQRPEPADP